MRRTSFILVAIAFTTGCGWFENPSPNVARLLVEGDSGKPVRVITSSRFVAAVNELGQTRVILAQADTTFTSLPVDRSFTISNDQRFFAEVSRLDVDLQTVRMQLFLDRKKTFDEGGPLRAGLQYRLVYTFNQQLTRDIEVL